MARIVLMYTAMCCNDIHCKKVNNDFSRHTQELSLKQIIQLAPISGELLKMKKDPLLVGQIN
jgi:hypothetical protein